MVTRERQAITAAALARIPRHPGPAARPVRCREGHMLGMIADGWLFQRHGKRESTSALPASVRCERCGQQVMIDAQGNT